MATTTASATLTRARSCAMVTNMLRVAMYAVTRGRGASGARREDGARGEGVGETRATDDEATTRDASVGIFDESHFKECKNLNLSMHKLVPASARAKRVLDMLEHGVSEALERGYVRSVTFSLTRVSDGSEKTKKVETVEEYRFNVRYGERGEVELEDMQHIGPRGEASAGLSDRTGKTTRFERLSDMDYIKKAARSMTRCLLSLVKTLETVPKGCTFTMNLSYVSGTPIDYEPPFFEAADPAKEPEWPKNPFSMSVGKVETEYHGLSLRVRSVLDPALDTDSGGAKSNPGSSQTSSLLDETPSTPKLEKQTAVDALPMSQELILKLSQPRAPIPEENFAEEDVEKLTLEWIRKQKVGTFIDAVACSKTLRRYPFKSIDDAFTRLQFSGIIEKDSKLGFSLVKDTRQVKRKNEKNDARSDSNIRKRLRSSKR